ncbi:MAG: 2TM domain-containing protein [Acidimicrobiales bacterium]
MTDNFARAAFREQEARQIRRRRGFLLHAFIFAAVNVMLVAIWAMVGGGYPWFVFPLLGWGIGLIAHGASAYLMSPIDDIVLEREQARYGDGGDTGSV